MKRNVCLLAFLLAFLFVAALGFTQEIDYLNQLSEKKVATFEDAVKMFIYTLGKTPAGFEKDVNTLKGMKLLNDDKYDKDSLLRRGMLSLIVARHLKLKGSLFYLMFDSQRYAHRACIAENMMDVNSSEWDTMTGDELLGVMGMVGERMEGAK